MCRPPTPPQISHPRHGSATERHSTDATRLVQHVGCFSRREIVDSVFRRSRMLYWVSSVGGRHGSRHTPCAVRRRHHRYHIQDTVQQPNGRPPTRHAWSNTSDVFHEETSLTLFFVVLECCIGLAASADGTRSVPATCAVRQHHHRYHIHDTVQQPNRRPPTQRAWSNTAHDSNQMKRRSRQFIFCLAWE